MAAKKKQPDQLRNGQETRDGSPFFTRGASFAPSSLNEEARTVDLDWSSGSDVPRRDWWTGERFIEALSMDPAHIRMGRLNGGAPLLDSHDTWGGVRSILGVVVDGSARIEGGVGKARVLFSKRSNVEDVFADVRDGIVRNVSVGYVVHKWQDERSAEGKLIKRTAIDWEPYEISMVAVPADASAQVRAFEDDDSSAPELRERGQDMTEEEKRALEEAARKKAEAEAANKRALEEAAQRAQVAERERCQSIATLCREHGIEAAREASFVSGGLTLDAVRTAILAEISERQKASQVSSVSVGNAQTLQSMIRDATDSLLLRAGMKVEGEGHRVFGDGNLIDMARTILESGGVSTRGMGRVQIATRALATSDFATILGAAGQKTVRGGYEGVQLTHRVIARKSTSPDFKKKYVVGTGSGQLLEKVPEGGAVPRSKIVAEMGGYALETYAKIIPFTRQMMVNDDFEAYADAARSRGRSAAETERKAFWDFVIGASFAGPTAPDGNAVFDNTNHANFPAASATPVATATLNAARNYFRNVKSLDNISMNADLAYIVAGTLADVEFDQLLNGLYVPTSTTGAVTDRMRRAQILIEPMISITKKHWYGFTDYNQVPHFQYAYLAGAEGPQFDQRWGFDVDGLELKVLLDFGVGVADWRGCYMQRES